MLRATSQLTAAPGRPTPEACDGAGDDLRGREREADVRGREDHGGGDRLGPEALRRADLDDLGPERLDDAPAAGVGPERDRGGAAHHDQAGTSKSAPPSIVPLAIKAREITPIVFWASLVPCASATIDDDATWPSGTRAPSGRACR